MPPNVVDICLWSHETFSKLFFCARRFICSFIFHPNAQGLHFINYSRLVFLFGVYRTSVQSIDCIDFKKHDIFNIKLDTVSGSN